MSLFAKDLPKPSLEALSDLSFQFCWSLFRECKITKKQTPEMKLGNDARQRTNWKIPTLEKDE